MKKTLALVLAVLMMLSLFSVGTLAAGTKTEHLFDAIEEKKEVAVTFRTGMLPEFGSSYSVVNTVLRKTPDLKPLPICTTSCSSITNHRKSSLPVVALFNY